MIEFEIKIEADIGEVRKQLKELNAEKINEEINQDQYFNHPNRDFGITDEALRIRKTAKSQYITYKGPKFDDKSKSRKEINVEYLGTALDEILQELDFTKSGIVRKNRETWRLDEITITLDKVQGLGEYVELEVVGTNKNNLQFYLNKLYTMGEKLGLDPSKQITKSYLELLREQ